NVFFFQAEDGIRDRNVTGVQTCALPICFPRGVVDYAGDPMFDLDGMEGNNKPSLETVLYGPSNEPFGQLNLVGGLRRAMAKCGYTDLKSFQKVGLAVR